MLEFWYDFVDDNRGLSELCKNKTRRQMNNAMRVVFGKKKDRGHLKQKIEDYSKDQKIIRMKAEEVMRKHLGYSFSDLLGSFGGMY